MKRKLLFTTFCFLFSSALIGFSQGQILLAFTQLGTHVKTLNNDQLSFKNAEGKPVSFLVQEELNSSVPVNPQKIKGMINSSNFTKDCQRIFRDQLWCFENVLVLRQ